MGRDRYMWIGFSTAAIHPFFAQAARTLDDSRSRDASATVPASPRSLPRRNVAGPWVEHMGKWGMYALVN